MAVANFLKRRQASNITSAAKQLFTSVQKSRPVQRISGLPTRYIALPIALWCVVGAYFFITNDWLYDPTPGRPAPVRMHVATPVRPLASRIPCHGARGRLLNDSPDDDLISGDVDTPYKTPFMGSYTELGLETTWMTPDGRYGPYGFGEDDPSYKRTKVDWNAIDWAELQDQCAQRNAARFPQAPITSAFAKNRRFSWRNTTRIEAAPSWNHFKDTRRTVLVLRTYEDFDYKPEDLWFIRSLITEAALGSGGEYSVVLLVNVQNKERNIFASSEEYEEAFNAIKLPPELHSIAILWDDGLLESWYDAIREHRTMWQVNQPLQLFALHYPEFDHYWQIEMDQRFFGDAGKYLDAISTFSRYEPRKQAFERASFAFSEQVSNTYANFTSTVNAANHGRSRVWGPFPIPDIKPIGPNPPIKHSEDDEFWWGVGEDADAIMTSFCADIRNADWVFQNYIEGFKDGEATPRWWCPPAVVRGSRSLLLTIHQDQHERGLSIPSEAVIPTWAIWHGLKLSLPPQPVYIHNWKPGSEFLDETSRFKADWRQPEEKPWFGYDPGTSPDGLGHADPPSYADKGLTWWWVSDWTRQVMDIWLKGDAGAEEMPGMLAVKDGKVYAPNFVMHPVKT